MGYLVRRAVNHQARILMNMSIRKGNKISQRSSHKLNQNRNSRRYKQQHKILQKSQVTDTGMLILWDGKQKGSLVLGTKGIYHHTWHLPCSSVFSLNRELGWEPASPRDPSVFTPHSIMETNTHSYAQLIY